MSVAFRSFMRVLLWEFLWDRWCHNPHKSFMVQSAEPCSVQYVTRMRWMLWFSETSAGCYSVCMLVACAPFQQPRLTLDASQAEAAICPCFLIPTCSRHHIKPISLGFKCCQCFMQCLHLNHPSSLLMLITGILTLVETLKCWPNSLQGR
jgi:hypothetical protein